MFCSLFNSRYVIKVTKNEWDNFLNKIYRNKNKYAIFNITKRQVDNCVRRFFFFFWSLLTKKKKLLKQIHFHKNGR